MRSIIYGPVSSWRLGKSLGIDLLSTEGKTCSFDCIYCQLGKTIYFLSERKEFVATEEVEKELENIRGIKADYATFSGMGEPTLAINLGESIILAKKILNLPVAVLSNGSLILQEDVINDLLKADFVKISIDAPNDELFKKINRPYVNFSIKNIIEGVKTFKKVFKGKLAIEIMFIEENKGYAKDIAKIVKEIEPYEVELNTPLRPCRVKPLTMDEMAVIKEEFVKLKVNNAYTVYEASKPNVMPIDLEETLKRRIKI